MTTHLLYLLLGFVILTAGAEALVRGAAGIARRAGLSALVVGLTVVAFGTSAPELAVSIRSALAGQGDIAIGNVVGSNIFNVAVILGITAMICPLKVHVQVIRWDMPVMLGSSLLAVAFMLTGSQVARWEGALLFGGIMAYTGMAVRMARREAAGTAEAVGEAFPTEHSGSAKGGLPLLLGLAAAGVGLLVLGAQVLVANAVGLARILGIGDAVIGLTIVAAGTSLPELATSAVAAFRKETDIAVGNIVGSNIFNLLSILGATALISPIAVSEVGGLDFGFMLGTSVLLLPLMRSGFTLTRREGGMLAATYGAYLFFLWPDP